MKQRRLLALISLISIIITTSNAQEITGRVINHKNEGIEYATVIALKEDSSFVKGAITNHNGTFTIHHSNETQLLKISCIGYQEQFIPLSKKAPYLRNRIILNDDNITLQGIIIEGEHRQLKMEGNAIKVNLSNGVYSKETNLNEVLRKLPGLTLKDEKVTTISGGKVIIYIDGKKVTSEEELQNIDLKNIKDIKLSTSPSSRFSASTDAVIMLTTQERLKGWSAILNTRATKNHRYSHQENLKINFNQDKLNFSGSFGYNDYQKESSQDGIIKIDVPNQLIEHTTQSRDQRFKNRTLHYLAGIDYSISAQHKIGMSYIGSTNRLKNPTLQNTFTLINQSPYSEKKVDGDLTDKNTKHHINTTYIGHLSDQYEIELYADYFKTSACREQNVTEENIYTNSTSNLKNKSESNYHLYALQPNLQYQHNKHHQWNIGGEYNYLKGDNQLTYSTNTYNGSNNDNKEETWAAYLSYQYHNKDFTLNSGLRYEKVKSNYKDHLNEKYNHEQNDENIFPHLSLSYKIKNTTHNLTYRTGIRRPIIGKLNSYSSYTNEYQTQMGNPQLQPERLHLIQYNLLYRFLYFSAQYRHYKNYIGNYFYTQENNPKVMVTTWRNFDKLQQLELTLNAHKRFGWYETSSSVNFLKERVDIPLNTENKISHKPMWMIDINNYFHLPQEWLFNLEYLYNSAGTTEFFTMKPQHIVNLKLQKSFFSHQLLANISLHDLFSNDKLRYTAQINRLTLHQNDQQDQRRIGIQLVWKINQYQQKKNKNNIKNITNRLQM